MSNRLGRVGAFLCYGCAALFCFVIVLQSLRAAMVTATYAAVLGLLCSAALLFLAWRFLPGGRWFLPALFFLRAALAISATLFLSPEPVQDFNTMYQAAVQLASGDFSYLENIYFFNWAYQTAFVAYEAFVIALFGPGLLPLQLLNALWLGATGCLVYLIALRFLPPRTARAVALLHAVYPAPLVLAGVLTNQHLAAFLFYLAIWLLIKKDGLSLPSSIAAGILIALGNAIRPLGIILLLAIGLFFILNMLVHRTSNGALPLAAVAVSYILTFSLLSTGMVCSGINPEGLSNNQPMWKFVVGLNQDSNGSWNRTDYEAYLSLPTQEADAAMRQAVKERLEAGPMALSKLALRKSAVMWGACEDMYWGFSALDSGARIGPVTWNTLQLLVSRFDKGVYLAAMALAAAAMACQCLRRQKSYGPPLFLAILVCGYYGVHLIVEVQSRYRYFLMPALFILAGLGMTYLMDLFPKNHLDPGIEQANKRKV